MFLSCCMCHNPYRDGQDMWRCRAPFWACNYFIALFQVDVICSHNDLMFSTLAYSDIQPFGAPGIWQNQGSSCYSRISPARRVMFLGACLLSTFSFRNNEGRDYALQFLVLIQRHVSKRPLNCSD